MKQHMTLCTLAVFIKIRKELYAGVHHLVFNFKQGIIPALSFARKIRERIRLYPRSEYSVNTRAFIFVKKYGSYIIEKGQSPYYVLNLWCPPFAALCLKQYRPALLSPPFKADKYQRIPAFLFLPVFA